MSESVVISLGLILLIVIYVFVQNAKVVRTTVLDDARVLHPQFMPTKTVSNDNGRWTILIDEKSHLVLICSKGTSDWKVYDFRQLIRSEVIEDGSTVTSTVRSSQVVGAVVGNALLGGAGLLLGGLTGKSRARNEVAQVTLTVTVNDTSHPLWTLPILNEKKPVLRSKKQAQTALSCANEAHAMFSALIRQADDAEKAKIVPTQVPVQASVAAIATPVQRTAFAEEFMKLSKLRDQGVLSEHEFSEMKTVLIVQAKKA